MNSVHRQSSREKGEGPNRVEVREETRGATMTRRQLKLLLLLPPHEQHCRRCFVPGQPPRLEGTRTVAGSAAAASM